MESAKIATAGSSNPKTAQQQYSKVVSLISRNEATADGDALQIP
jgi:hypothetical protein